MPAVGTRERGRYEQLVHTLVAELDSQALWIHRKHESLPKVFGPAPDGVAGARKQFGRALKVMTGELSKSRGDYLLGGRFSAADILFVHCLDWAEQISWLGPGGGEQPQPELAAYLARCRERPAYREATALRESSAKF